MACTSKQAMASEEATPYEQEFDTEVEQEIVCSGENFSQMKSISSAILSSMHWGRVPFDFVLERIVVQEDSHKDLILNVTCNQKAHDPHWRCAFTITVLCSIGRSDEWQSATQSMNSSRSLNTLIVPILRFSEEDFNATFATLKIKIKINSYAGNCPSMIKSFDQKTTITDATLIVDRQRLYVSRSLLAMHSTFFHTLLYDKKFKDAAKEEFEIPDVSFDDMVLFLNIIYPNVADDKPFRIVSADAIESMLALAERFGADCVKRLMEKYLMGEMVGEIEGFTLARRLLISDRFRLSAPSSLLMNELKNEKQLRKLGETEEYNELSESIRAAILDMRVRSSAAGGPVPFPDSDEDMPEWGDRRRAAFRDSLLSVISPFNGGPGARRTISSATERLTASLNSPQHDHRASFTHFRTDLGRLQTAIASLALTSSLSNALAAAVAYLHSWAPSDYAHTSSALKVPLHGVMVTLINSAASPHSADSIGATVQRFIDLVDSLRLDAQHQSLSSRALRVSRGIVPIPIKRRRQAGGAPDS